MAAKVNTKFVVILSIVVVVLLGGVTTVAVMMLRKTPAQLAALAEQQIAAGNYEKGVEWYGKAVFRDQANPELLQKWIDAMERYVPASKQALTDTYWQKYMPALRQMAEVKRTDLAAHKRYLDEWFNYFLGYTSGAGLNVWEDLLTRSEQAARLVESDAKMAASLKRYTGIAKLLVARQQKTFDRVRIDEARKDLEAAYGADGTDADVAGALADIDLLIADQARLSGDAPRSEEAMARAGATLDAFLKANPGNLTAMLARAQVTRDAAFRAAQAAGKPVRDALPAVRPAFEAVADGMLAAEPDSLRALTVMQLAGLLANMYPEGGREKAVAVLDHAMKAKISPARYLLTKGRIQAAAGLTEEAMATYEAVVKLPNLPVSADAVVLSDLRINASAAEVECVLSMIKDDTSSAERAKLIERAKERRNALAGLAGEDRKEIRLLDAKIKLQAREVDAARVLITAYLERDAQNDTTAMLMLAEILRTTGNSGEARRLYERVAGLQPSNIAARAMAAQLALEARDFAAAESHLQAALLLDPSNQELARNVEMLRQARALQMGRQSTDKVMTLLQEAEKTANGPSADPKAAIAMLRNGIKEQGRDPRLVINLIGLLAATGDRAGALDEVREALKTDPGNAALKNVEKQLSFENPLEAQKAAIAAMDVPPVRKHIYLAQAFSAAGKTEEAEREVEAATKADAEDPVLLELMFNRAIAKKDIAAAKEYGAKATAKNADQLNGLSYMGRIAFAEGKYEDSANAYLRASEIDRYNPLVWRLLGDSRFMLKQIDAALTAYAKALEIKPGDVYAILGTLRCYVTQQRLDDALMLARNSSRVAGSNEDFMQILVALEAEAPSGDRKVALEWRRRQAAARPDDMNNRIGLAQLMVQAGELGEARKLIDELKAKDPTLDVVTTDAMWHVSSGDAASAKRVVAEYAAKVPKDQNPEGAYLRLATLFQSRKQMDEAIATLQEAAKIQDPKTMPADRQLAAVYLSTGRYDDAAVLLKKILAATPDEAMGNTIRRAIAECYLQSGKFAEADELVRSMGEAGAKDQGMILIQANAALGLKDRARARTLFDRAVAAEPSNAMGYFARAEFLAGEAGRDKDIESDLQTASRIAPKATLPRVRLGNFYAVRAQWENAIEQYNQAIANDPDNDQLRLELVNTLQIRGRARQAAELVSQAITRKPESMFWKIVSADTFIKAGMVDQAVPHMEQAWAKDKSMPVALAYAEVLMKLPSPNLSKARDILSSPEITPEKSYEVLITRARVYQLGGQSPRAASEAVAAYKLVNQDSSGAVAAYFRGFRAAFPQRADQAKVLEQLKAAAPMKGWFALEELSFRCQDPATRPAALAALAPISEATDKPEMAYQARELLGQWASTERRFDDSVAHFRRALELFPDSAQTNNNLAYVLGEELKKPDEALPFAEKAVKLQPVNSSFLDTLGTLQMRLGKHEEAAASLLRGLSTSTNNDEKAPVLLHLAELRIMQKNPADARKQLDILDQVATESASVKAAYGERMADLRKQISGN